MKKRIIISVTNEISYDQRMLKTASTLVRNGFEVQIVGRTKPGILDYPDTPIGISIHRLRLIFSRGKFFYLEYQLRLLWYLLFQSADILCAVDLDTILPNLLVSKVKRKPLVYDAHEYFTEVPELTERVIEKKIWKFVERISIPHCDRIYTVSTGIAAILEKEYHRKVDVIYNYPISRLRDTETTRENVIIYQGDLNEGRGLEIAINAMDKLDGWELWIVGDGYAMNSLKSMASRIQNRVSVKFLGRKTPEELRMLTQKAKLGINLLENKGLNYYYSLANKFFDYIQSGVIPISMNFPEYNNIQEQYHCSILIPNLDETQYIDAVKTVLSDENKWVALQKNCDIAASFFTWEKQEEKLSSIYKNV